MSDTGSRITESEIAKSAYDETGRRVTPHQLKYWRRLGLIARPRQEGLTGKFGTRTTYPAGTEVLVAKLLDREGRSLDELVRIAWEHERPLAELRPALLMLFDRALPTFRSQFQLWSGGSRQTALARTKQIRRRATQVHRRHRSVAAYVVATLMFGHDPRARGERRDAGAALADLLPARWWRPKKLGRDFSSAVRAIAKETSHDRVRAMIRSASAEQFALVDVRLWSAWRPANRLGIVGGDESWFAFLLLLFVGLVVSQSFAKAYFNLGVSSGTSVSKLAGAVKHLAFEHVVRATAAEEPLPEVFESDDLPPEFRHR
jgi:hypothetical protein